MNNRNATYYAFFAIVLYCMISISSCKKDTVEVLPENVIVVCDTLHLNAARISFTLQNAAEPIIVCAPADGRSHGPVKIQKRVQNSHFKFDLLGLEENTTYRFQIFADAINELPIHEKLFSTPATPQWVKSFLPSNPQPLNLDGFMLINTFDVPGSISGNPSANPTYSAAIILDKYGKLIWARCSKNRISAVRYTSRGTILTLESEFQGTSGSNHIIETTLGGDTLVHLIHGSGGFTHMGHHDIMMTENHQFLIITEVEKNGVKADGLLWLDRNGQKIWEWDTSSIISTENQPYIQPWGNSLYQDFEGNYILSFRNIHQVWKLNKNNRQIIWRLGKNGSIPLSGTEMFLTQHMAQFIALNKIMMFDNGQDINWHIVVSPDHRPYSRIAIYEFNSDQSQVISSQFIDLPPKYFSWAMGSVNFLGDSYLVGASWPAYLLQLDLNGNITTEWKFGNIFYRIHVIDNFME